MCVCVLCVCVCTWLCIKDVNARHVESVILLHSSGALMNFITQQRYKLLNYNQSRVTKVGQLLEYY